MSVMQAAMRRRRPRRSRLWILFSFVLALGLGSGAWVWYGLLRPVQPPPGGALVRVTSGESFAQILSSLHEAGLLPSPLLAAVWARWSGVDRAIQPGDYLIDQAQPLPQILARLRSGPRLTTRLQVPEGQTLRQIAAAVAAAGLAPADAFLSTATDPQFLARHDMPATGVEGYLFPDTYELNLRVAPEVILQTMLQRFREQSAGLEAVRTATRLSRHQWVTLASIVEREARVEQDRALIAAVFRNRLRIGMRLQADPTAVYERASDGPVHARDLDIDSPYNTYLYAGLPPGPICNPGLASLAAAARPADVEFLYFVARGDGSHVFSRSLDEHNRHVAELRRRRRGP